MFIYKNGNVAFFIVTHSLLPLRERENDNDTSELLSVYIINIYYILYIPGGSMLTPYRAFYG